MRKILLVEFKFHQEIIPTQLEFLLKNKDEVHLFLNSKLWDDYLLGIFQNQIKITLLSRSDNWLNKMRLVFLIRSYIKKNGITHIVFNTMNSNFNAYVLRFISKVHSVGIIHRVNRLQSNKTQMAAVKKLNGVLTLSHHTLTNFKTSFPNKKAACFYPIFFSSTHSISKQVAEDIITIAIPGQFDTTKKDYKLLINAAIYAAQNQIPLKFILLGDASKEDGRQVIQEITKYGLNRFFYYQLNFIPYKDFFYWMDKSDYVLPLFTKDVGNYGSYLASQISASFNWAFAFRKQLIIPDDFSEIEFVKEHAKFYNDENFIAVLSSLKKLTHPPPSLPLLLSFENQQAQYLSVF